MKHKRTKKRNRPWQRWTYANRELAVCELAYKIFKAYGNQNRKKIAKKHPKRFIFNRITKYYIKDL